MWKTVPVLVLCACSRPSPPLEVPVGAGTMEAIGERIYAEPGLTDEERQAVLSAHRQAAARLGEVFGPLPAPLAVTFCCRSPECKLAFDGELGPAAASGDLGFARDGVTTTAGWQAMNVVVVTGPQPGLARLITHELVHATMKNWAPYDTSPTWFNEGLAVLIAGGPECPPPFDPAFDVTTLDSKVKWQAHLQRPGVSARDTYCKAQSEVARWAARFDGPAALGAGVKRVLECLAAGEPVSLKPVSR